MFQIDKYSYAYTPSFFYFMNRKSLNYFQIERGWEDIRFSYVNQEMFTEVHEMVI